MNRNVLIVLGGGFIIALLVAMIVSAGLKGGNGDGPQILVAARNIEVGHDLTTSDVKWQSWPANAVSSSMIVRKDSNKQKLDEVAKGKLRRDISANEPVLTNAMITEGVGNVLAAALQDGRRAVAIKVKAESMVGGFIAPGDRVDVIMTYEVHVDDRDNAAVRARIQKYAAETVLENVRVLAIDQQSRKDDDKAKVARTVTLEVDAEGAERVNLASAMGDLTLSLRPIGDTSHRSNKALTTDAEVSSVLKEINRIEAGGGAGPSNVMRVYNGENVQNIVVRKNEPEAAPKADAKP